MVKLFLRRFTGEELQREFEEEQSIRLSDDEREDIMRDNTRKIYMAATRAGQRLVVTYVGDYPKIFQQVFMSN